MRYCGPLLLCLLLLSLPAWAQVERNPTSRTSRSRASTETRGWINPGQEESSPAWTIRQELAVRRLFRSIVAEVSIAQEIKRRRGTGGSQTIAERVALATGRQPQAEAIQPELSEPLGVALPSPEPEQPEAAEEDQELSVQSFGDAVQQAEPEAGEPAGEAAAPEQDSGNAEPAEDQPVAEELPADTDSGNAEPAEDQPAAEELPADTDSDVEDPQRPDFRLRRDRPDARPGINELLFPEDEAAEAVDSKLEGVQEEASLQAPAGLEEAEGMLPTANPKPEPAILRPVSPEPSGTGGAQAPVSTSINMQLPGNAPHFEIPTDIDSITRGNSKLKQVALTFDDGPHPDYTSQILTVLDYYNCPATFFFVGVQANRYPQWLQMAHQQGHEIASQTYDHFRLPKLPLAEKTYQIDTYQDLVEDLTGERPRFLRPPGGQMDDATLKLLRERGMVCAMWDVALNDTHGDKSRDEMLAHVMKEVRNGSVILAHDGVQATIDMLPELIERLREEGYELVTMSELASGL